MNAKHFIACPVQPAAPDSFARVKVNRTGPAPEAASGGAAAASAPGLSNDHIRSLIFGTNRKPAQIEIWRGGTLVKCSREMQGLPVPTSSKRGEIHGFSRRSRSRMMQTQAKIRWNPQALPFFMGNTCPDVVPEPQAVLVAWSNFCRRFKRRFTTSAMLWRKELKDRQSGTFIGAWVPHYHSFAINCPEEFGFQEERGEWVILQQKEDRSWSLDIYALDEAGQKVVVVHNDIEAGSKDTLRSWWTRNWYEAMGSGAFSHYLAGTSWEPIETLEGVRYYTSKYMAKPEEAGQSPHCIGRWWGIVARENIPWAERVILDCSDHEACVVMRALRHFVLSRAPRKFRCNHQAMNYFVNDPSQWERLIEYVFEGRNEPF